MIVVLKSIFEMGSMTVTVLVTGGDFSDDDGFHGGDDFHDDEGFGDDDGFIDGDGYPSNASYNFSLVRTSLHRHTYTKSMPEITLLLEATERPRMHVKKRTARGDGAE